jgi:MoxR-like ATPase
MPSTITSEQLASVGTIGRTILDEVGKAFIGPPAVTEAILTALVARGHVLIEGNPGIAKTTLVKAFAPDLV